MSKQRVLNKQFFNRDVETVAKELLGMYLVRAIPSESGRPSKKGGKEIVARIVETEAYVGPEDKASHAHRGRTKRNEPMFGEAGHWYVYLCYGIHNMLNIVTGPKDHPAAVLIRGIEIDGERINGPGRVTKALSINRKVYNEKVASKETGLWIASFRRSIGRGRKGGGERMEERKIKKGPRVGVDYAGPKWSKRHLRFRI